MVIGTRSVSGNATTAAETMVLRLGAVVVAEWDGRAGWLSHVQRPRCASMHCLACVIERTHAPTAPSVQLTRT